MVRLLIVFQAIDVIFIVFAAEENTFSRSAYFVIRENRHLAGHIVKQFKSPSLISCSQSCLRIIVKILKGVLWLKISLKKKLSFRPPVCGLWPCGQRPQTGVRKLSFFFKEIFNQRTPFKILTCLNLVTLRFLLVNYCVE